MARIAFVDNMGVEKLGILYLSSVLKQEGHQVDVFLEPFEPDFIDALKSFQPDFVGFGSFIGQESEVVNIFSRIKSSFKNVITIQGGPSTTIYSDLIYHPSVDFVLKGDGEETLLELIHGVETNADLSIIPGLFWKDNGYIHENSGAPLVTNFDDYPPADRDLHMKYSHLRHSRTKPFLMTRGCPYPCTFCGTATLNKIYKKEKGGPHFRYGVGERTIAELEYVKENYGLEWVQFHDATFNANRKFVMEFLELYISKKMPPFICNIRSENIKEEVVKLLKEAGCDRVTMGIQSGNEHIRKTLSARRTQTDENIFYACSVLKKYGIRVHIDLIFGWPGEKIEQGWETIDLARKIKVYKVNRNVMIYYPDSPITEYAYKNKFLEKFPDVFDVPKLANPFVSPLLNTPDINKLINLDKLAHYFINSRVLSFRPTRNILLNVKPNRLYYFLKNLPALKVALIYDARNFKEKVRMIYGYIKSIINIKCNQIKEEAKANKAREEVALYKSIAMSYHSEKKETGSVQIAAYD